MLYYAFAVGLCMPHETPPESFVNSLQREGYSVRIIAELWKWYDYSSKKGVASF